MKKIYSLVCALALGAGWASAQVTIGGTNYATLEEAWADAKNGDVIELKQDVTVGETLLQSYYTGEITIKSAAGRTFKISRTSGDIPMFVSYAKGDVINFENVILDGASIESAEPMVKANFRGVVNMKNVNIVNGVNTEATGIINVFGQTGAALNADNLTISDCEATAGVVVDGVATVKNACSFSAYLADNSEVMNVVTDEGLNGGKVTVLFNTEKYGYGDVVVKGTESSVYFASGVTKYALDGAEGNLVLAPVVTIGETPYDSLDEAWAAAVSGDEIVLHGDVVLDGILSAYYKGAFTIKSAEGKVCTITRGSGSTAMFLASGGGDIINLENVVLDGASIETAQTMILANNRGVVNLKNVTVANGVTTGNDGLINANGSR
ncbi:MAG: hypothetical protein K2K77_05380, partial [Duncaniella sp.]|nr:hypothetical protein [Duncaniella sp.]